MAQLALAADQSDLTLRARIREAALRLLARHGTANTSIRMVAEEAGVSPGAVTHHFRSKEKLVTAVQEAVFERLGEAIAGVGLASPPDVAARQRRVAFDEFLAANPHVEGYMRTMYLEGGPAGRALFAESFELVSTEMEQLVSAGVARRLPEPEIGLVLYRALTIAPIILRPLIEDALGLDLSDPAIRARFREATVDILTRPIFEAGEHNPPPPDSGTGTRT